jgi:hypothetical protein
MGVLIALIVDNFAVWGPPVATFVGWVARKWWGDRKWWEMVRKLAYAILADPNQTDDAKEAVARALLTAQVDRVASEAAKVKDKFVLNGSNKVPKLDIDLEELK